MVGSGVGREFELVLMMIFRGLKVRMGRIAPKARVTQEQEQKQKQKQKQKQGQGP